MILEDRKSQEEAREYVLKKAIIRPKTTILSLVLFLLKRIFLGVVLGVFAFYIIKKFLGLKQFYFIQTIIVSVIIEVLFSLKRFAIYCVECYQHYAPEEYRRMCLCKPTCSEYAILVLKKYIFIKAIYLIYIRLTKTCRDTYKIDNP